MPMGTVAPVWRQQFCDPAGNPFANGTVEVFIAGTSTHAIVYQDQTVSVPHPWPIPLNAGGMTAEPIFLIPGSYHFYVKDVAGVVQWDDDLISSVPASSLDVDTPATFGEAVTLGTAVYESTGSGGLTPGLWYKTSATNAYASSSATIVGLATADYAAGATGFVRLVGRMTKLSGLVVGAVYYASATPGAITNVKPATNVLQIGIPDSTSSILLAIVVAGQFQTWTPSGGIANVVGELHIGGNTTITGTFSVSGTTLFSGGLTVSAGATAVQGLSATSLAVSGPITAPSVSVSGAAAVGSLGVSGNATITGVLQTQGVIYPGRIDVAGMQTFAYLGSHQTYGLYTNMGLYVTGTMWSAVVYTAGVGSSLADLTIRGATNFQSVTCTQVNAQGGGINCGPLVSTTITCTTINAQGNTITCGAISCNALNTNGSSITSGPHSCSTLTASSTVTASGFVSGSRWDSTGAAIYNSSEHYWYINNAERMHLSPGGNLFLDAGQIQAGKICVAVNSATNQGIVLVSTNPANTCLFVWFLNSGQGGCGYIQQVGSTGVNYVTSSDCRLKTDRGRATDVSALRDVVVHDFEWTEDRTCDIGLFAQEAHALFPRAITPGTDERTRSGGLVRPWGIDYSKLVSHLIVGWQHHAAKIEALEAQLAALKGSV